MDDAGVKPKPTLEELASEGFPDLSRAELQLLRAVPQGSLAHCGDPAKDSKDPVNNGSISYFLTFFCCDCSRMFCW
jgi:hypothetical protein